MTLYTISEAATHTGLSHTTLREWLAAGTLPVIRTAGGRPLIDGRWITENAERIASARHRAGRADKVSP